MAHYLITFNKQISNDKNLFGFKIFDSKQASLYMHCVNLLSQEAIFFEWFSIISKTRNESIQNTKIDIIGDSTNNQGSCIILNNFAKINKS